MLPNKDLINIGDIIFQSLKDEASFVQAVSESAMAIDTMLDRVNHVGLYIGNGEVIEASLHHGVAKQLLEPFLSNAKMNILCTINDEPLINSAVKRAVDSLGCIYNASFYPDDEGFYCSELIVHVFKNKQGGDYFQQYPMNFCDNTTRQVLPYWISYYEKLQKAIPHNVLGSHPQQLLKQTDKYKSIRLMNI